MTKEPRHKSRGTGGEAAKPGGEGRRIQRVDIITGSQFLTDQENARRPGCAKSRGRIRSLGRPPSRRLQPRPRPAFRGRAAAFGCLLPDRNGCVSARRVFLVVRKEQHEPPGEAGREPAPASRKRDVASRDKCESRVPKRCWRMCSSGSQVPSLGAGRGPPTGTSECRPGLDSEAWEAFAFLARLETTSPVGAGRVSKAGPSAATEGRPEHPNPHLPDRTLSSLLCT